MRLYDYASQIQMCFQRQQTLTGPSSVALCWQTEPGLSSPPQWGRVEAGTVKQTPLVQKRSQQRCYWRE